jgi:molecular chaperone GrpE
MDKNKVKSKKKVPGFAEKVKSGDRVHEELEMVKGMLARALADYDNLSKRVDRERQDLGKMASVGVIIKLLPVLDNLESAQVHLKDQGLAISIIEFKKVLSEEGLTEIKPVVGELFDEQTMEAIEVVKGASDNMVAETVLVGWKFEDEMVVRHAKVKVERSEISSSLSSEPMA